MGKWDAKVDLRLSLLYWLALIGFIVYCLVTQKFLYVYFSEDNSIGPTIRIKLFQYLDYFLNMFVCLITAAVFEETVRRESIAYIRSLPLAVWELWFHRYFRILYMVLMIVLLAVILGISQTSRGLNFFLEEVNLITQIHLISPKIIFFRIALSTNFCILLTMILLIITRNRILTCTIIFCYFMIELGPVGNAMGKFAWFYGSFGSIPLNLTFLEGREFLLLVTAILELVIPLWYRQAFRQKNTWKKYLESS